MPTPSSSSPLQSVKVAPANGVLSVPASAIQDITGQKASTESAATSENAIAPTPPRLKVVIRRLAPKMTQEEFEDIMGDDWKMGGGKVDWTSYVPGKLARE